jgi:hypothetical protein
MTTSPARGAADLCHKDDGTRKDHRRENLRRYPPAPLQNLTYPLGIRTRTPVARDGCLHLHHFKV